MKKTLLFLTLTAAIPIALAAGGADGGHRGHRDHGARLEHLGEKLELTEEQKTEVNALFEEQHAVHEELRENMRARLAEVLTPEQSAKLEGMRIERKERWKGKKRRHGDCDAGESESG